MAHVSDLIAEDIDAYLVQHQHKSLLRFITCGSVDDGKSTLIGRLLYDSKMIFEDQMAALEADSKRVGTQGGEIDFALLVDGLAAEREQGITIDVAYRFFSTDKRKFIVADTPGHEQYTRNMVTGASTADLAVILIDARKGVLTQTRRHSYLVSLLGIRNAVLAVNKMDLIGWDKARYDAIVAEYMEFAERIGLRNVTAIPMSGLRGDNVSDRSTAAPWYSGPSLLQHLEDVPVDEDELREKPFRMAVQWVNRPDLDFRGFSGMIAGGAVRPGDTVLVLGCGGVGLAAILGARLAGAARIIAADRVAAQLPAAVANGATDTIDAGEADVAAAVRDLTGGAGADHGIEVVGTSATIRAAYDATRRGGRVTLVGSAAVADSVSFPALMLMTEGKRIQGSVYGASNPPRDIPVLADLAQRGRLDLEALVTRRIGIDDVEAAFTDMTDGRGARSVVCFE